MNAQTNTPTRADILVVDDTPSNLHLLFQTLSRRGYRVRIASGGRQALESVSVAVPELILLDVRMPGMDGYEVCRRLKASELARDIPIIFLSALVETEDKVKAFTAGGVDYITKPFQDEEIWARVETHLALRHFQKRLQEQNEELQASNQGLAAALAQVRRLSGLLPMCANCKKIRNDQGYWEQVEVYIHEHSEADFSHGFCPDCAQKLYPKFYRKP
jgi:PleD family two-component response regulator